ncbi:hypothetical protein E2C01_091649 [Portunus trituberculatus]|uniref:Uncharacterized protein n=1 Tax=Portunus trituberculatus TaxID=210409 RepID=A0A5B7JEH5_PORTR|nr:hypothetical protein [Portunus trituberculatus]
MRTVSQAAGKYRPILIKGYKIFDDRGELRAPGREEHPGDKTLSSRSCHDGGLVAEAMKRLQTDKPL